MFTRRTIPSFLALLFLAGASIADAGVVSEQVFKVTSVDPALGTKRFGSGLVLRENGKLFVLTSDHVIYRGGSPYRHFVESPAFGRYEARFVVADWGRGIAVLELGDDARAGLATLSIGAWADIGVPTDERDVPVHVLGYPAASARLFELDRGTASWRLFGMPMTASLAGIAFVAGSYAEFGMSGGVVAKPTGEFVGVLSHLRMRSDSPGEMTDDWSDSEIDAVFVIPHWEISEGLATLFKTGAYDSLEYRQPELDLPRLETEIEVGRLRFHATHRDDITAPPGDVLVRMDVELLPKAATPRVPTYPSGYSEFREFETRLAARVPEGAPIRLAGLRYNLEQGFDASALYKFTFYNPHQFFKQIQGGGVTPVFAWGRPDPASWAKKLVAWRERARKIADSLPKLDRWNRAMPSLLRALDPAQVEDTRFGSEFSAWMGVTPSAIERTIRYYEEPADRSLRKLLDEIGKETGKYAL